MLYCILDLRMSFGIQTHQNSRPINIHSKSTLHCMVFSLPPFYKWSVSNQKERSVSSSVLHCTCSAILRALFHCANVSDALGALVRYYTCYEHMNCQELERLRNAPWNITDSEADSCISILYDYIRDKRAYEPINSNWEPPPMILCNSKDICTIL